jgi:hypothetical protein
VTGEVLAIANCEDQADYATDEMALMVLGYLCAEAWGDEPAGIPELPDPSAVDNATVSQDTITNLQELATNGNLLASSLLGLLS